MKSFKTFWAFFILLLALTVAFLSRNPKTSKMEGHLTETQEGSSSIKSRENLVHVKHLKVNWADESKGLTLKDLRLLKGELGKPDRTLSNDDMDFKEKQKKVEFRIRPSEEFYQKFQENDYDVEGAIRDIDLKRPPVKGEIKINF